MNNKDFESLKKQLKGYEINCIDTVIISVTTDEGVYNIIKDTRDMYLVEYIPNVGYSDISYHFSMHGAIGYIKGVDKYREGYVF